MHQKDDENLLDRNHDQRAGLQAGRGQKCSLPLKHVREKITLLWTHYETAVGQYGGQLDDMPC